MSTLVRPPPYALRVRSNDPDEVTSWAARRDGDHSRVVRGTGPYGFRAEVLEGQDVRLAWARTRLGQTLRGRFRQPCVQIPLGGTQQYAFGRQRVGVAHGALVFIAPGTEASRHSSPGSLFGMDLDWGALAAEVQGRRPGSAPVWPQLPLALEPPGPLRRAFQDAIAELVRALDPAAPASQRQHCESRLISTLADVLPLQTARNEAGRLAVQRLADLESWIEAHLGEAITVGRLCEVAQVGERSLQLSFNARRGMSPMRFVCERRLAAAHRRISRAEVRDQITGIATSLGFTHLGRFSVAYREAFGEPPSRTWRRSRA
jgi:AraC-like DNA-binding protein